MSKLHQFVDQPRNDTLGATIKFWRNAFGQRGDLSNPHGSLVGTVSSGPTGSRRSKTSTRAPVAAFHGTANIPDEYRLHRASRSFRVICRSSPAVGNGI